MRQTIGAHERTLVLQHRKVPTEGVVAGEGACHVDAAAFHEGGAAHLFEGRAAIQPHRLGGGVKISDHVFQRIHGPAQPLKVLL